MSAIRDILASDPHEEVGSSPPPPQQQSPHAAPQSRDHSSTQSAEAASAAPKTTSPSMPAQPNESKPLVSTPKQADNTTTAADNEGSDPSHSAATTSVRRNANGTISSVYSGNKMRHLKKDDGIPLWRKDIQYDFLRLVFFDETPCFTKQSDGTSGHTFVDVYIDAMAKSSKTSKILKEKLLADHEGARSMAMVCLLVNLGRMNTTLNFFPEMRAQLRTYHAIPVLQAQKDPGAYKQLQDAPRLKSILKGACEDEPHPTTIEEMHSRAVPRTNPVNLIFVLCESASQVNNLHFQPPRDFYDLVMRSSLSSTSRARAFLWLMWWYLESDFKYEDTQRNPFGPGQWGEGERVEGELPEKVPPLESLTEEQAALENVDTEEEGLFGEAKRKERIAILASEPTPAMTALKRARNRERANASGSGSYYDDELSEAGGSRLSAAHHRSGGAAFNDTASDYYTRSPSPSLGRSSHGKAMTGDMRINNLLNNEDGSAAGDASSPSHSAAVAALSSGGRAVVPKKGPGRGNWRRNRPKAEKALGDERPHPVPLLPNTQAGALSFVTESPHGQTHLRPVTPGGSSAAAAHQHAAGQSPPNGLSASFTNSKDLKDNNPDHVPTPSYQSSKRHRAVTQHQSALLNHRRLQIDYLIDKRIRVIHSAARRERAKEGPLVRAWKRLRLLPADYDSDEEGVSKSVSALGAGGAAGTAGVKSAGGKGASVELKKENAGGAAENSDLLAGGAGEDGLSSPPGASIDETVFLANGNGAGSGTGSGKAGQLPLLNSHVLLAGFARPVTEPSDVGEEAKTLARALRCAKRRLQRWQDSQVPGEAMIERRLILQNGGKERLERKRKWKREREEREERWTNEAEEAVGDQDGGHRAREEEDEGERISVHRSSEVRRAALHDEPQQQEEEEEEEEEEEVDEAEKARRERKRVEHNAKIQAQRKRRREAKRQRLAAAEAEAEAAAAAAASASVSAPSAAAGNGGIDPEEQRDDLPANILPHSEAPTTDDWNEEFLRGSGTRGGKGRKRGGGAAATGSTGRRSRGGAASAGPASGKKERKKKSSIALPLETDADDAEESVIVSGPAHHQQQQEDAGEGGEPVADGGEGEDVEMAD